MADMMSTTRFQKGGRFLSINSLRWPGVTCMFESGHQYFSKIKNKPAIRNPTSGETTSDMPISLALRQFTPSLNGALVTQAFAKPTPSIDPISVCELEAGMPKNQVPKFQAIAAVSIENTITKPRPVSTSISSSTGSK